VCVLRFCGFADLLRAWLVGSRAFSIKPRQTMHSAIDSSLQHGFRLWLPAASSTLAALARMIVGEAQALPLICSLHAVNVAVLVLE
jgi:hypothetical protein